MSRFYKPRLLTFDLLVNPATACQTGTVGYRVWFSTDYKRNSSSSSR